MTLKSIRNSLFALGFCVLAAQGFVLIQSLVVIEATLMDGAPDPVERHDLSEFETFLSLFG